MLVPITNWFDDPVRTVNAVGNELFGGGERVGIVSRATSNARRLGIELGREPLLDVMTLVRGEH
jgi:hypothetical protein